ncbi:hypothetical protein A9G24_00220 [Gilliamella sp. App6-5]|jgi:hypothetical protein|uniref:hypothetical protein n=1 Tax=Gilliamella sp. App6-5 TaxID=3120232 RepID=UPI00080E170C|nr:hypothetical protein [Gilliamella apicola]OCG17640.1 hypothetical protein A9G24_00220 [Gilliamella apicola]
MWKNISTYLNKNRFLNTPLCIFFCFIILYFIFNQYYFIAEVIFYIPTTIYIVTHYKRLLSRIKKWILLGFGVLFFFSRIYAEKSLSYIYGIHPEYLNYSVSIYATLVALYLGIILIFLYYFVSYEIKSYWWGFLSFFTSKYQRNTQSLEFCFARFVMIGMFSLIMPLSYAEDLLRDYCIIADAYPVSDCGEKYKDVVYIRKNNAQCYSIKLTIPPVFNIVEAEK